MYRRFALINSQSERWELTDVNIKTFLNSPQGLGFSNSFETGQYGNVLQIIKEETAFPVVSGNVVFYQDEIGEKYQSYNQFVNFLSYSPLVLEYYLPGVDTFYLDVMVQSLGKSEVELNNILNCPISLQGLGMWHGMKQTINTTSRDITVTNNGHFPVGFKINVQGTLAAPYIDLKQNGELYGEAKFEVGPRYSQIMIDSRDGMQDIQIGIGGSVMPNPLSYQDLSISNGAIYVTFMKLARGTSVIEIRASSMTINSCTVEFSPIYRSV